MITLLTIAFISYNPNSRGLLSKFCEGANSQEKSVLIDAIICFFIANKYANARPLWRYIIRKTETSRKQLVVSTSHFEISVIAPLIRFTALTQSIIWHDSDWRLQDFHNTNGKDLHLKRKSARKQTQACVHSLITSRY